MVVTPNGTLDAHLTNGKMSAPPPTITEKPMYKIEYRGTLVFVVIPGDDRVTLANLFDPDGNPLTLTQPNHPAEVG
jgi:hypothetical protein